MPRIKTTPRETRGTRLYQLLIGLSATVKRSLASYRGHQNILHNRISTLEKRSYELHTAHLALQRELSDELDRLRAERNRKANGEDETLRPEPARI